MGGFIEQVVKRDKSMKSLTIKILAVVLLFIIPITLTMLAFFFSWAYLIMVALFLFIGGIYIVWYVFSCQKVEYEYAVAGDSLGVAKIIALRRRKKMCSVNIKDIELLEKGDENIKNRSFAHVFHAVKNTNNAQENYYAVWRVPARGNYLLVFNPNEKVLQAMKPYMNKDLMIQLFYKNKTR